MKFGIPALTVMLRKSVFEKVGLYDENLIIEDWDMWIRIADKGSLAFIIEKLAYYRMHDNNISSNLQLMMQSRFQIIEKWKAVYPEIYKKASIYWRTEALKQFSKNSKDAFKYLNFDWEYLSDKKYRKYLIKYIFYKIF